VAMTHTNRKGMSKLLKKCTLPITGINCVKKIVTDLAVINVTKKGFELLERAPGVTVDEIINSTDAELIINGEIAEMSL
jgi:3-oxoacid CoA-transferase subunit B